MPLLPRLPASRSNLRRETTRPTTVRLRAQLPSQGDGWTLDLQSSRHGRPLDKTQTSVLTTRLAVSILVTTYLLWAVTFSVLTRAYEADDEQGHVQYVEYVVEHGAIPHISVANLQESHQPPLYYLLVAGWQDLLRIPAFTPVVVLEHYKDPYIAGRLFYSHNYTASQHRAAVDIHILRLLSVLLGLGTVLLTFAAAKVVGMGEPVALSAGLFVALMPRFLVVSSAVTNDALVIPLCSLAIVLFLLSDAPAELGVCVAGGFTSSGWARR